MSNAGRAALLAAVVVVAVVGFIILKPSDSSDTKSSTATTPTTAAAPATPQQKAEPRPIPEVRVKGGKPVGGIKDLTFAKGESVQFAVVSDVADEVHVHGYDFHKDVAPGKPVKFKFPAKIDGEFEVELESRGEQVASLKVTP
jgi:heme/copper-type cytochrome/quinol oxidase subunit 2